MTLYVREPEASQFPTFAICLLASVFVGCFCGSFRPTWHFVLGVTAMPMTVFSLFVLMFATTSIIDHEKRRFRFWGRITAICFALSIACAIVEAGTR